MVHSQQQAVVWGKKADEQRKQIDARLEATRANPNALKIVLDVLCEQFSLSDEERVAVLVLVTPAISPALAQEVFSEASDDAFYYVCPPLVANVCMGEPVSLRDAVRLRNLWLPDGTLVREKLVEMNWATKYRTAVDLNDTTIRLSEEAFAVVTGTAG